MKTKVFLVFTLFLLLFLSFQTSAVTVQGTNITNGVVILQPTVPQGGGGWWFWS